MNNKTNIRSISIRPTHGTAKQVIIPTMLPKSKADKELFWVKQLLQKVATESNEYKVFSNPDDSDGKPDVIADFGSKKIGIQVTELTYELERTRVIIKKQYISKIIEELKEIKIKSKNELVINIFFPYTALKKPTKVKAKAVAQAIYKEVQKFKLDKRIDVSFGKLLIQQVRSGELYVPNIENIGIDINFDQVPRSLPFYKEAIDLIVAKKSKSKSDWLLIWSVDFYRDKHWLGSDVIAHMKSKLKNTSFEKIYFAESINGERFFQANLKLTDIK